jgi:hypothetical protein
MFAKSPAVAWLLAALTCFLAGMAVVESRHQAVALPAVPPVGVVVTVEVSFRPTATPEPTPFPTATSTPDPDEPTPPPGAGGTGNVR